MGRNSFYSLSLIEIIISDCKIILYLEIAQITMKSVCAIFMFQFVNNEYDE